MGISVLRAFYYVSLKTGAWALCSLMVGFIRLGLHKIIICVPNVVPVVRAEKFHQLCKARQSCEQKCVVAGTQARTRVGAREERGCFATLLTAQRRYCS